MPDNLSHALANDCTDPDCEIHNIEVGCEEGALSEHDLAMWFAGAAWASKHGRTIGEAAINLSYALSRMPRRTLETDLLEDR